MYVLNGFHAAFLKPGRQAFQQPLGRERIRKSRQIGGTRDYVAVVAVNLINQPETVIAFEKLSMVCTMGTISVRSRMVEREFITISHHWGVE